MNRALVVDDHPDNRDYLEVLLRGSGYEVLSAANGAEALVLARQALPDLVISDLLMPVMDGYTLLRHWKLDSRLKLVPFVVYTATYTSSEDQQLAMQLGADAFLLKPAEPEVLLDCVQSVRARVTPELPATRVPIGDDNELLTLYNETLVRKLEEKTRQLEQANRALLIELDQRKDIEQALRDSEQRLLTAQEVAQVGSWEASLVSGQRLWTEQAQRIFETQPQQALRPELDVLARVHPDDRDRVRGAFLESLQDPSPRTLEHRLLMPDGRIKFVEQRWQVFHDDRHQPLRALGTCRDITASKLAELEITRADALLRAVIDGTPDSVYVKDRDGHYLLFSPGACAVVGLPAEDVLGKDDASLFGAEIAQVLRRGDLYVMASNRPHITEENIAMGGVSRTYMTCKAPYRDGAGQVIGVIGVSRDISERRRMEVAMQQTLADLDNRNRVLRDFAFVTSEDLREPLGTLRALSGLLVARHAEQSPEQVRAQLERMNQICARMQVLIDDVLTHSRVKSGRNQLHEVDLTAICADVLDGLRDAIRTSGAQLHIAPLPFIRADPIQMRQLFHNLLSNALKFRHPQRPPQISIRCEPVALGEGSGIRLDFIDNGIGIEQQLAERIFDPFQRMHIRSGQDSAGVGLTLVSRIVDRHRGTVQACGNPGEGARFSVTLPMGSSADPAGD